MITVAYPFFRATYAERDIDETRVLYIVGDDFTQALQIAEGQTKPDERLVGVFAVSDCVMRKEAKT